MQDTGFTFTLVTSFLKRRMLKPLADFLCTCLKNFTPIEFEEAIRQNWSLVNFLITRPREEVLKLVLQCAKPYPEVMSGLQGILKMPSSDARATAMTLFDDLHIPSIIDLVGSKLPAHARVMRKHRAWLPRELAKAKGIAMLFDGEGSLPSTNVVKTRLKPPVVEGQEPKRIATIVVTCGSCGASYMVEESKAILIKGCPFCLTRADELHDNAKVEAKDDRTSQRRPRAGKGKTTG